MAARYREAELAERAATAERAGDLMGLPPSAPTLLVGVTGNANEAHNERPLRVGQNAVWGKPLPGHVPGEDATASSF